LNFLRNTIGKKVQSGDSESRPKTHRDFLVKEMLWMSDDFDRERKKKAADSKKLVRACRKKIQENEV